MKEYLGDGVYVELDRDDVVLTTGDGIQVTNRIVLEMDVLENLKDYLEAKGYGR